MPTFSVVIPTFNRAQKLQRLLNSLLNQTYDKEKFEVIVVNDGSTDDTSEVIALFKESYSAFKLFEIKQENKGRIAARNAGMDAAENEFITWADDDDEYLSTYLEVYAKAISENPDTKIFTGGTVVYNEQILHSSLRDAFLPDVRPDGRGCVQFKSGRVSTGGFVFDARLARTVEIPGSARVPYGSADSFPAVATQKYPELATLYGQNADGQWLPFGNPWGDDWLMFYLLTRENVPVKINYHPYLQHVRQG